MDFNFIWILFWWHTEPKFCKSCQCPSVQIYMDLTVYWLRWPGCRAVCLLLVCRVSGVSVRWDLSWEQLKSVYLWAAVALAQMHRAYRACLCVTDERCVLSGTTGASCSWRRFTMCSTCPAWTRRPAASPSTLACRYWYQRFYSTVCHYINTHTRVWFTITCIGFSIRLKIFSIT